MTFRIHRMALALVCLFLFTYGSWQLPFLGPDEPRYSQIARQMFESGDLVVPHLGGNAWFEKPVLLYWLIAFFYRLFGTHEFAARIPSALSAIGCIWMIQQTVRRLTDDRRAWICALILATTAFFIGFSHAATFDMLLTFCVTAALCLYLRYEADPRPFYLYGMYAFCGAGVLAKGFVALILIGLSLVSYLLISRRPLDLLKLKPVQGVLIIVAVTSLWFVPVTLAYGARFWDEFFVQHHLVRYTSSQFHRSQGAFFYLPILVAGTYPWSLTPFFSRDPKTAGLRRFALCWLLSTVVFFSLSQSKLPGYILPAIPPFAILAGLSLSAFEERKGSSILAMILLVALNAMFIGSLYWGISKYEVRTGGILVMIPVIVAATMAGALLLWKHRLIAGFASQTVVTVAGMILFVRIIFPGLAWDDTRILCNALDSKWQTGKLVVYHVYDFGPVFYLNGKVDLTPEGYLYTITDYQQLYRYVSSEQTAFVLVGNEELAWIRTAEYWKVKDIIEGKEKSIVELQSIHFADPGVN